MPTNNTLPRQAYTRKSVLHFLAELESQIMPYVRNPVRRDRTVNNFTALRAIIRGEAGLVNEQSAR
jgi:hypothetical protein